LLYKSNIRIAPKNYQTKEEEKMRKQQKKILVLAIIAAFMATALFLPGLTYAGEGFTIPIDKIPWIKAFVEKTGQTTFYETGDDGDLVEGFEWPNPRFTDNKDGTVTDNLTGLIWLKNANCFGQKNWYDALDYCNGLANGGCDLMDGSVAGDWRLPNIKELQSLIHHGVELPALPNTDGTGKWAEDDPFTEVKYLGGNYWSSTTSAIDTPWWAWRIFIEQGYVDSTRKEYHFIYVWPVRGGN
jgi:hypothetical protein